LFLPHIYIQFLYAGTRTIDFSTTSYLTNFHWNCQLELERSINHLHISSHSFSFHAHVAASQTNSYAALPQYSSSQSSVHLPEHSSHHHHHHQTGYNNFFNHSPSDTNKFYHHSTKGHAQLQAAATSHKVEKEREEGDEAHFGWWRFRRSNGFLVFVFFFLFSAVNQQILQSANQPWPALNNNLPAGTSSNEYSSHLLSAALPISLQHLLKYSENIKKENGGGSGYNNALNLGMNEANSGGFNFNLKNGNLNLVAALGLNNEVSSGSAEVVVPTVPKRTKAAKPRTRNPPAVKKPRERKKKAPKVRKTR
jgi:hypothetical protein